MLFRSVENLTALEYTPEAGWQLYFYHDDPRMQTAPESDPGTDAADAAADADVATLLQGLLVEFKIMRNEE